MFCCGVKRDPVTVFINQTIEEEHKRNSHELKLLLLGTGESGKSTFLKQLKILSTGFVQNELDYYRTCIHSNILSCFGTLCTMAQHFGYMLQEENRKNVEFTNMLMDRSSDNAEISIDMVPQFKSLWEDPSIQATYQRRVEYTGVQPNIEYYMQHIDRISGPTYFPNNDDVLQCRVRTTGIHEFIFSVNSVTKFRVLDMGGQRGERKKWLPLFDCVTSVIFLAAISEYDEKLVEDSAVNRIHEALTLFDEIVNKPFFRDISFILFLNKSDLFKKKLEDKVDLRLAFPDFYGPQTFENASEFIKGKFLALVKGEKRVYTHFTCATDTTTMSFVFAAVKDSILNQALSGIF